MRTDLISETLAGVIALASRGRPEALASRHPTEAELQQALSSWVSRDEEGGLLARALAHDRAFGGVRGRGFFRIFADSEHAVPLTPSFVIASRAAALERRGGPAAAELLYRSSFAAGETDTRTEEAIERQTAALLAPSPGRPEGLSVEVAIRGRDPGATLRTLRGAAEVRAFLEGEMASRITLADLFDVLDIASPLVPLTGIELHGRQEGPMVRTMRVVGTYGGQRALWYDLELGITAGFPEVLFRNIRVDRRLQGLGIGARSLLAISLFALRHGIEGWHEAAHDDGPGVWLRLGGEPMEGRPVLPGDDVLWVQYRTDRVLASLIDGYFPQRVLQAWMAGEPNGRARRGEPRDRLQAEEGFRAAYQRGSRETAILRRLRQEQAAFFRHEASAPAPCPAAIAPHPLQPLPLAPAALLAVGGMAFHPVR